MTLYTPKVSSIRIPKGLVTSLVFFSTKEKKAIVTYYQLKSLFEGGIIFDYKHNRKSIAATFGYSETKLRFYVDILLKKGLASMDEKGNLTIAGTKVLHKLYPKVSEKKAWKVDVVNINELESYFEGIVIHEKELKETFELRRKLEDAAILRDVGIVNPIRLLQPNYRKKLLKAISFNYEKELAEQQSRSVVKIANLECKTKDLPFFPFVTLTREGVAKTNNRKSKSTGQRLVKKLERLGIITDARHEVFVSNGSYEEYQELQRTFLDYDFSYKYESGSIIKVMPNMITVNLNVLLSA